MFRWLRRLRNTEDRFDMYKPKERLIFHYFNGSEIVDADPMVLYKRVMAEYKDIHIEGMVARSLSKDAPKMHTKLASRIRTLFDIKPLQGVSCKGTLTDTEVINLLDAFYIYCGSVSKKSNPMSTTPEATSDHIESTSGAGSPTENTSASGSVAEEPSTEKQSQSTSVPGSPSVSSIPESATSVP